MQSDKHEPGRQGRHQGGRPIDRARHHGCQDKTEHGIEGSFSGEKSLVAKPNIQKCDQEDQRSSRQNNFSERDLLENLRLHGVESPAEVRSARIERNGDVSVVRGKPPNG